MKKYFPNCFTSLIRPDDRIIERERNNTVTNNNTTNYICLLCSAPATLQSAAHYIARPPLCNQLCSLSKWKTTSQSSLRSLWPLCLTFILRVIIIMRVIIRVFRYLGENVRNILYDDFFFVSNANYFKCTFFASNGVHLLYCSAEGVYIVGWLNCKA